MGLLRVLLNGIVLTCFLIQTHGDDQYTDQNRPYEFGFRIDGQQHRHEKKDKNGIIMGEFGFITADDVYHVTVYATDEQGRFRILSMKNIHLKDTKSVTSVRQGHSLQIPSTHQVSAIQVTSTTTTTQPTTKIEGEFQPISLEPPVNSCSHCSLPTTSTAAPKRVSSISQTNSNNVPFDSLSNRQQIQNLNSVNSITPPQSRASYGENNSQFPYESLQQNPINYPQNKIISGKSNYSEGFGPQSNLPYINNKEQGNFQNFPQSQDFLRQKMNGQNQNYLSGSGLQNSLGNNNYATISETQQTYNPNKLNGGESYSQNPETNSFTRQGISGKQNVSPREQNNLPQVNKAGLNNSPVPEAESLSQKQNYATFTGTRQTNTPQERNGKQSYPQVSGEQYNSPETRKYSSPEGLGSNYRQTLGTQQNYKPYEANHEPKYVKQGPSYSPPQSVPKAIFTSNTGFVGSNNQNNGLPETNNVLNSQVTQQNAGQTTGNVSPYGSIPGARTPKQLIGQDGSTLAAPSQKPTLTYAQMQIVDKNTDIHARGPGEKEGLPEGLTENDMVRLLYTFNYTLSFQGHFEEGYSNGFKQGYYFVTGRNGVRTRIDYTADDKGFHPKISQDVLDLLSDDVPKPETERQAKYGLKGYEFKWLYYPLDSQNR